RDEALLPADAPAGAILRRTPPDAREIGTGLPLRQAHGRQIFSGAQPRDPIVLLLSASLVQKGRDSTRYEARDHLKRVVRAREYLRDRRCSHSVDVLTAKFFGRGEAEPAITRKLLISFAEAVRHDHTAIFQTATLRIAQSIYRCEHFRRECREMRDDRLTGLAIPLRFFSPRHMA